MIGAIAGDIIGSIYEGRPVKTKSFALFSAKSTFTDDTVLTVAVADALLTGKSYKEVLYTYSRAHPNRGFGGNFRKWFASANPQPYYSFGNGSAMRVSPVGWVFNSPEDTLKAAANSAAVTHNHPEGIKGAQATALAVFLSRSNYSKAQIKAELEKRFRYNLKRSLSEIRPGYSFEVSCQKSVPEAIIAFLEGTGYEDTVRNAVSLGGDADTQACIAGAVAEAYYGGVPDAIRKTAEKALPDRFLQVIHEFYDQYINA